MVPVCLMLAAIYTFIRQKDTATGIWLGIGILTKWFPLLLLPAMFRFRKLKAFLKIAAIALALTVLVWGFLYITFTPDDRCIIAIPAFTLLLADHLGIDRRQYDHRGFCAGGMENQSRSCYFGSEETRQKFQPGALLFYWVAVDYFDCTKIKKQKISGSLIALDRDHLGFISVLVTRLESAVDSLSDPDNFVRSQHKTRFSVMFHADY